MVARFQLRRGRAAGLRHDERCVDRVQLAHDIVRVGDPLRFEHQSRNAVVRKDSEEDRYAASQRKDRRELSLCCEHETTRDGVPRCFLFLRFSRPYDFSACEATSGTV